jgi:hypothetical protein
MDAYLPLALFIAVPVLLVVVLRTSAAILFFCVASAVLLQRFVDQDAAKAANALLPNTGVDYLALAVLVVPTAIAAFVFRKTVKTHMLFLHILVAVLSGLTLSLVASSFLPSSWLEAFERSDVWREILNYQTIVVGSGFLLSVICLAFTKPRDKRHKH